MTCQPAQGQCEVFLRSLAGTDVARLLVRSSDTLDDVLRAVSKTLGVEAAVNAHRIFLSLVLGSVGNGPVVTGSAQICDYVNAYPAEPGEKKAYVTVIQEELQPVTIRLGDPVLHRNASPFARPLVKNVRRGRTSYAEVLQWAWRNALMVDDNCLSSDSDSDASCDSGDKVKLDYERFDSLWAEYSFAAQDVESRSFGVVLDASGRQIAHFRLGQEFAKLAYQAPSYFHAATRGPSLLLKTGGMNVGEVVDFGTLLSEDVAEITLLVCRSPLDTLDEGMVGA